MIRLNNIKKRDAFLERVMAKSGQNLRDCLQCGKCSGTCPVTSQTVGGPRGLIAKILGGMREQVLKDTTWWHCVSCGSCANRCPVEINIYPVATVLCEMATRSGLRPSEPEIHLFEELFLKSVRKHGRANELSVVLQFNLRTLKPFKDAVAGACLLLKGAIRPEAFLAGAASNPAVARIFERVQQVGQENKA